MSPGTGILSTGPLSDGGARRASGCLSCYQRAQLLVDHVGVDLGGGDVGMTQHLDTAQVGAAFQQVAGEGVAQHVRRNARRVDAGRKRRLLEQLREALARQMAGRPREGNR